MESISPLIPENYKEHLLGRLKLLLFQEITGSSTVAPSVEEMEHFILASAISNVRATEIVSSILSITVSDVTNHAYINTSVNVDTLFEDLRAHPLSSFNFVEITNCASPWNKSIGALVTRGNLQRGGHIYDVTLFDDRVFPAYYSGYIEVGISTDNSKVEIGFFDSQGNSQNTGYKQWMDFPQTSLAMQVLNFLFYSRRRELPINQLCVSEEIKRQKPNDYLVNMIATAYNDKLPVTRMRVPFSTVRPYDMDYCLGYPLETIEPYIKEGKDGVFQDLLVYWDGSSFIMDDDYALYLAYRCLDLEEINVAALGLVPEGVGKILKTGGRELVPPVRVKAVNPLTLPISQELLLDRRLKHIKSTSNELPSSEDRLMVLYLALARLLQKREVQEKDLHRLLLRNPVILDVYGTGIMSEIPLRRGKGTKNSRKIDLILQYNSTTDKRIVFVELENAIWKIFTKSGDLRREVNHATRQVEDWLAWWQERPGSVPTGLDSSLPAEGLVVIGRSHGMDKEDTKRLVHMNHNRKVKVITYDDLLNRLQQLILKRHHNTKYLE